MKLIYCWMAIGMSVMQGYGQTSKAIQPITVGDYLPDTKITNVYNYPTKSIQTRQLKSKIIILDFWATWCGSCIAAFPKMEKLRQTFKDSITILMVNNSEGDNHEKVSAFFKNRKKRAGEIFNLAYVLEDTLLLQYFPHEGIPHYVWVDSTGKVLAITGEDAVTEDAIRQRLAGNTITARIKDDSKLYHPVMHNLAEVALADDVIPLYKSVFTPFLWDRGYTISAPPDSNGLITRYTVMNASLFNLYRMAYGDVFRLPFRKIFVDPSVQNEFADSLNRPRRYCYECIMRPITLKQAERNLQFDLQKSFNIQAIRKDTMMLCNVLTSIGDNSSIRSTGSLSTSDLDKTSLKKFVKNTPVNELIEVLSTLVPEPWVDETHLEKITMNLPGNIYDLSLEEANAFLASHNLRIEKKLRTINIALLTKTY